MNKTINIISFDNFLEKDSRSQFCVMQTQKRNPTWKFKIWTEEDPEVRVLLNECSDFLFYGGKYEYVKLNLMKKYGGLWSEADQIFGLNDLDEGFSYLATIRYRHLYMVGFFTWWPVYINKEDPFIISELELSIKRLKSLQKLIYKPIKSYSPPETIYQLVKTWDSALVEDILENIDNNEDLIFDFLGLKGIKTSKEILKDHIHISRYGITSEQPSEKERSEVDYLTGAYLYVRDNDLWENSLVKTLDFSKVDMDKVNSTSFENMKNALI